MSDCQKCRDLSARVLALQSALRACETYLIAMSASCRFALRQATGALDSHGVAIANIKDGKGGRNT